MEKRKKKILTLSVVLSVIFIIALTITLLFIPYKMTTLNTTLKKAVNEDISSITVQTSPCCGPMEGARRTYTISTKEFIDSFKAASKDSKAKRDYGLRTGGKRVLFTIVTKTNTYEIKIHQNKLQSKGGDFYIINSEYWEFIYDYPADTFVETDY